MAIITNESIKDYQVNGSWSINGSMKPDSESEDAKKFTLRVRFKNVPVIDIVNKSLDPTKIQWVNGPGRKNFDTWNDNQIIDIDFKSPGRAPVLSPIEQFKAEARAAGVDMEDVKAVKAYISRRIEESL